MGDSEHLQPSKKRVAGRQLTKDNPEFDDEEISEQETGTFKKASDEVLAGRRIVRVRKNKTAAPSSTPASANPFAGIQFPSGGQTAPKVASAEAEGGKMDPEKVEEKDNTNLQTDEDGKKTQCDAPEAKQEPVGEEKENLNLSVESKSIDAEITEGNLTDEKSKKNLEAGSGEGGGSKDAGEGRSEAEAEYSTLEGKKDATDLERKVDEKEKNGSSGKSAENSSFSSFHQLSSSQNAFTGLSGTGFSSSTFSFGSIAKDEAGSGSLFGMKSDQPFGIGLSGNENTSLFGTSSSSSVTSVGIGFPTKQELSIETGEENEKAVFAADSMLFEFIGGSWKERGKGELKVNVSSVETGKARLVMRSKGNYRLILNASLYADMKLTNMEKKGVTFACINSASEGKDGLSTYAVKFKDPSIVEEFKVAVTGHKGQTAVSLKTPENSRKASDV
ncbi:scaffold/adaptor protein [Lithospermum erythrorhizon]|uniref:Scaffold/adaptor protein n=1 Tax=Lithospermum erythrorhizon TaxID=34254 RepID=A0AAV3QTR0_LITER